MKSDAHKYYQSIVKEYYIKRGWIAIIEHYIQGKKIDVVAQNIKTKYTVANEIQLGSKHFIENISLDFKVGCNEVKIISADKKVLEEIKNTALKRLDNTLLRKTSFQLAEEFIPLSENKEQQKTSNKREFIVEFKREINMGENLEERR